MQLLPFIDPTGSRNNINIFLNFIMSAFILNPIVLGAHTLRKSVFYSRVLTAK